MNENPVLTIHMTRSDAAMVRALIRVCIRGNVHLAAATVTLTEYRRVLDTFCEAIEQADQMEMSLEKGVTGEPRAETSYSE